MSYLDDPLDTYPILSSQVVCLSQPGLGVVCMLLTQYGTHPGLGGLACIDNLVSKRLNTSNYTT